MSNNNSNNSSSEQYKDKVKHALQDKSTLVSLGIFVLFLIIAGILIFTNQKKVAVSSINGDGEQTQTEGGDVNGEADQASPTPATGETYTVQEGDTLWSISQEAYESGYNWVDIVEANNIQNPDNVPAGTQLQIPSVEPRKPEDAGQVASGMTDKAQPKVKEYTVQAGDTLWGISQEVYGDGYSWTAIAHANNLTDPNVIIVGQKLTMPNIQ